MAIITMDEIFEKKYLLDFLQNKIEQANETEINSQNMDALKSYKEKKSKIKKIFKK